MKLICDCGNEGEFICVNAISENSKTAKQTYLDDEKFESACVAENPAIRIIVCKKCGKKIYC